jgi:hypothetical protein
MRTPSIVCTVLILAGGACAGSQADQVRDARMEQADAKADAEMQLAEDDGTARDKAIEQRHEAVNNSMEATNPPGKAAEEDMVSVSEDRMKFQSDAKTKLDKLGARIDSAREKITVLGGKAPTALKSELATASHEYKGLADDVSALDQTPATSWEATTNNVEKRIASLDERVDELTDKIEDV